MYDAPDAVDRQAEKFGHVVRVPKDFLQKSLTRVRRSGGVVVMYGRAHLARLGKRGPDEATRTRRPRNLEHVHFITLQPKPLLRRLRQVPQLGAFRLYTSFGGPANGTLEGRLALSHHRKKLRRGAKPGHYRDTQILISSFLRENVSEYCRFMS